MIKGPALAGLERGHVVVLAEPGGAVAVVLEQAADRGLVALDDAVVAGEAGGLLRDHAKPRRVVVAAGDQGGPGGGAERRGEHAVVTQSIPVLATRSIAGVGITPPKVLGTPKPASSVMISSTLGALCGGVIRVAHQGLDCNAASLITPPKGGAGAGNWLPARVVVASGAPRLPLTVWANRGAQPACQPTRAEGPEANDGARETACPQSAEQATDPGERRNETGISHG